MTPVKTGGITQSSKAMVNTTTSTRDTETERGMITTSRDIEMRRGEGQDPEKREGDIKMSEEGLTRGIMREESRGPRVIRRRARSHQSIDMRGESKIWEMLEKVAELSNMFDKMMRAKGISLRKSQLSHKTETTRSMLSKTQIFKPQASTRSTTKKETWTPSTASVSWPTWTPMPNCSQTLKNPLLKKIPLTTKLHPPKRIFKSKTSETRFQW